MTTIMELSVMVVFYMSGNENKRRKATFVCSRTYTKQKHKSRKRRQPQSGWFL